ncbi:MAG: LOG family protein, partial [Verrucomicrobiota bacterium]
THAFALFPGGFGTLDESFEALTLMQTGKARIIPVVLLDRPDGDYWQSWLQFVKSELAARGLISDEDFSFFKIPSTVDDAVAEITSFYRVYHSARWVGEQLVIRLQESVSPAAIEKLNSKFADVLRRGSFVQTAALPAEKGEPEIAQLPRLVFWPHRRNFGRLRQLIDAINQSS